MAPKAELLLRERLWLTDALRIELVVWLVPQPVRGSTHTFKYRLALVRDGQCVLRYDNEAGKGDHKHVDEKEVPYDFVNLESLLADFRADVRDWSNKA
jgi:hypothetical protein